MSLEKLSQHVQITLGPDFISSEIALEQLTIRVFPASIVRVLTLLRDNAQCRFRQLIDICGVDYPERPQRFDVVYHLLSVYMNHRIRIKIAADEKTLIPSVSGVFSSANWYEREAWDLYGILFSDHPDLRRLLTDYNFDGHPMRKDFPLTGFLEVRYDEVLKRVVYDKVILPQEFRTFDFMSPWEGIQKEMGEKKPASLQEETS